MPNWYWEKKDLRNTPSQAKGMDFDTETRYRREGVRFILEIGRTMSLYHLTLATGAVYFHRFYMFHAFQDFPRYVVATCCLFLAGKAEETPKKCRDIVRTVRTLTNDEQFATFGLDPREEIMVLERVLLQTIKFDLQVDHPYQSIIKFAKSLKGDSAKLHKMVQMSWTFVNDSLCTTLCLQWEPEIIAIAVMYLAAKLSKFEVKDWENRKELGHEQWWDMYVDNLETADLEEVCHQVLDLYIQQPTPARDAADSPPQPGTISASQSSATGSAGQNSQSIRQQSSIPGGQTSENSKLNSSQQPHKKTTPPNPPQPKSRPQTPPPLPPNAPTGGSLKVEINWGWNECAPIQPSGSRGPNATGNYSQVPGSATSGGMQVSGYPPAGYGIPPHINALPTGPPPGVYPGAPRDHPGSSVVPHGPPPPSTAAPYNYHSSGYYPGGPPPQHPPTSNYHQGSRY